MRWLAGITDAMDNAQFCLLPKTILSGRSLKQVAHVVHSDLRRQSVPHWPSWAAPIPLTCPLARPRLPVLFWEVCSF